MSGNDFYESYSKIVEEGLRKYFPGEERYPGIIRSAMEHSLFGGGKRFRPVLTITAGCAFGKEPSLFLPTACAFEYIHTYSLIHDDLPAMDNDDMRRGKPTCHVVFGEDMALLAGDGLFAEAFYIIGKYQSGKPVKVLELLTDIAAATGIRGMVSGQALDIRANKQIIGRDELMNIHLNKTAKLIMSAAKSGAVIAGAEEADVIKIEQYALNLGVAFQLVDDVLDITGDTKRMGKPSGSDAAKEKPTAVSVFGIKGAMKMAEREISKAIEIIRTINGEYHEMEALAKMVIERDR